MTKRQRHEQRVQQAAAAKAAQAQAAKDAARAQVVTALFGRACAWCGADVDVRSNPGAVDAVLRCGDQKAVNRVPACAACVADRGDESASTYFLRARSPNRSVLWAALRAVKDANPTGRMAQLAHTEQVALWSGRASLAAPVELGPSEGVLEARHALRDLLWARDGKDCVWCSQRMRFKDATLEHLQPQSCGGQDHPDNLALACKRCNSRRGSIPVLDWLSLGARKPRLAVLAARGYVPAPAPIAVAC